MQVRKMQINIQDAKAQLSRMVDAAMLGEEVIIAKAGQPVVRLVAISPQAKRELGSATGQITWQEGWHLPLTGTEMDDFLA